MKRTVWPPASALTRYPERKPDWRAECVVKTKRGPYGRYPILEWTQTYPTIREDVYADYHGSLRCFVDSISSFEEAVLDIQQNRDDDFSDITEWLLRNGIAPYQTFHVNVHAYGTVDQNGEYDSWANYDIVFCEPLTTGQVTSYWDTFMRTVASPQLAIS